MFNISWSFPGWLVSKKKIFLEDLVYILLCKNSTSLLTGPPYPWESQFEQTWIYSASQEANLDNFFLNKNKITINLNELSITITSWILHILAFFNNRRCLITILRRLCSKQCMEHIPTLLSHTRLTNLTPVIQLMTDK